MGLWNTVNIAPRALFLSFFRSHYWQYLEDKSLKLCVTSSILMFWLFSPILPSTSLYTRSFNLWLLVKQVGQFNAKAQGSIVLDLKRQGPSGSPRHYTGATSNTPSNTMDNIMVLRIESESYTIKFIGLQLKVS